MRFKIGFEIFKRDDSKEINYLKESLKHRIKIWVQDERFKRGLRHRINIGLKGK